MSKTKKAVAVKKPATVSVGENDTSTDVGPKPFSSSVKGNALSKVKSGFVTKKSPTKVTVDKYIQTDHPGAALVTGDKPSLEYWKLLAEERGRQVEALQKDKLESEMKIEAHEEKITILEQQNLTLRSDNESLEGMLKQAKELAEYIEGLPDSDEEEDSSDD